MSDILGNGADRDLNRDGVSLRCSVWGSGERSLVFIHGLGCNRHYFEPQVQHFSSKYRIVAVDLRGHGASEGPVEAHAIQGFASDVAWQCAQLQLDKPVLVGHSMGGHVAAQLAADFPDSLAAVVFLDSSLLFPSERLAAMRRLVEQLHGPGFRVALRDFANGLFSPWDDVERREGIVKEMSSLPQEVMVRVVTSVVDWPGNAILPECNVPALYVAARHRPEFPDVQRLCPAVTYGQVIGSGHFPQLEVPDQVNSMIERFLKIHDLHASQRSSSEPRHSPFRGPH